MQNTMWTYTNASVTLSTCAIWEVANQIDYFAKHLYVKGIKRHNAMYNAPNICNTVASILII